MNSKEQRSIDVGDTNRRKIAKSNAVMPGGPQNNSPIPVEQSSGTDIRAKSIYNDFDQQYDQMGTRKLDPMNQPPSQMQQEVGGVHPMGQRLNAWSPYGLQPQPPASQADVMAAQNYKGNSFMGLIGMPAQPAPGAFPSAFPGSSGPPMMQGVPDVEAAMNQMRPENSMNGKTPGSTPTKIKKKRA